MGSVGRCALVDEEHAGYAGMEEVGTRRRREEKRGRGRVRKRIVARGEEGGRHACLRAKGASWAILVTEARGRVAVDTAGLGLLAVAVARRAA